MLSMKEIQQTVSTVAQDYPIKKIELFGSYADGVQHKDSDLDLLVEFNTPFTSLLTVASLKIRLEELTNMKIDIVPLPLSKDSIIEIGKVVPIYES